LTFFPPLPPLYKFTRTLDGEILLDSDSDDEDNNNANDNNNNNTEDNKNDNNDGSDDDNGESNVKNPNMQQEREDRREIHPAQQLTEQALLLRSQAKTKNKRDTLDAQIHAYTLLPAGYSG